MNSGDDTYCILLHVVEGVALNVTESTDKDDVCCDKNTIVLNATLNSTTFEVEGHCTDTATIFNSNCIWECRLDDIKKMKVDRRPVKIECFMTSKHNPKTVRQPIGFLLLPLKEYQPVTMVRNVQIKLRWYKLGGLRAGWRRNQPELYLFLMIVKKTLLESGKFDSLLDPKRPSDISESVFIRPSETSLMLKSQNGIFVELLEDERLIQVGDNQETDKDIFIVALTFKCAKDLEQLICGGLPDDYQNALYCFHYNFLGSSSNIELISNGNDCYSINEKISLSFKSSLQSLRKYFKQIFYIPIALYFNDSIIANYRFEFSKLLPETFDLETESVCEANGTFFFETVLDVLPSSKKPCVDYMFSLKCLPSSRPNTCEILVDERHMAQSIDHQARGDMAENTNNNCYELPPTIHVQCSSNVNNSNCLSSRAYICEKENNVKQTKSGPVVLDQYTTDDTEQLKKSEIKNTDCELERDEITTRIVEELEKWKNQQLKHFLYELKQKEIDYLAQLSAEWEEEKNILKSKLESQLELCTNLNETLEQVQEAIKKKGLNQMEKENAAIQARDALDKRFTIKIIEMEEHMRLIKEDMECKIVVQEFECKQLRADKLKFEKEKEQYIEKIACLQKQVNEMRKTFLPREQLAGLFHDLRIQSERLIELEKSKNFYKVQWSKIVREVHELKVYSLQKQEEYLRNGHYIGLQNCISDESKELHNDRIELDSIKDALLASFPSPDEDDKQCVEE